MPLPNRPRSRPVLVPALLLPLIACAAGPLAVAKRQLDVQTRLSDAVFLEPSARGGREVWVEVRNGTDKPELDLEGRIRGQLAERGYRLAADPARAGLILQASVLQAGRTARTAAEGAYRDGYGSAVTGGLAGGAAGYGLGRGGGNGTAGAIAGGLGGAAVAGLADAFVQDVAYTIVVDLQILERAPAGVLISQVETAELRQGQGRSIAQSSSLMTDRRRYRTRVVSTAERVNLDWDEAAPPLVDGLSRAIAGLL